MAMACKMLLLAETIHYAKENISPYGVYSANSLYTYCLLKFYSL